MSFLLDQLKKSGKKRQIELAILEQMKKSELTQETQLEPEYNTVPEISSNGFNVQQKFLYMFLGICVISVGLFFWWKYNRLPERKDNVLQTASLGKNDQPSAGDIKAINKTQELFTVKEPEKPKPKSIEISRTEKVLPAATKALKEEKSSAEPKQKTAEKTHAKTISEVSNEPQKSQRLVDITELPQTVRSSLPKIKISSHLYKKDSPIVSINGRIMTEGNNVADDLYLEEITPEGVILSYRSHRFSIKAE